MSRKDTLYGHRHKKSAEEIERIRREAEKKHNIKLTKLEADAVVAERSKRSLWSESEFKKFMRKMRGVL